MDTFTMGLGSCVTGGLTTHPQDNARAVILLRAARTEVEREIAKHFILHRREMHRQWVTETQRKWQVRPKSEARERYMRC